MSDPAAGVGVLAAMAAGAVSFLSPCVLPLVPGYLSAVVGVAPADLDRAGARRVLPSSLVFVGSFSLVFILLGLGATSVGSALRSQHAALEKGAAGLIIGLGVYFLATTFVTRLNREWHVDSLLRRAGSGGPLVAGAAFAIAWTPCVGPTLGAILSAAALARSVGHAAMLLASYSAGLAIPFLATALAFGRMTSAFVRVKRHFSIVIGLGGAVLVAMGVLIGQESSSTSTSRPSMGSTASDSTSSPPSDTAARARWAAVRAACAYCFQREHLAGTLRIAFVVGIVLTTINQGGVILGGDPTTATWVRCGLNFLVPFVVSNAGLLSGRG